MATMVSPWGRGWGVGVGRGRKAAAIQIAPHRRVSLPHPTPYSPHPSFRASLPRAPPRFCYDHARFQNRKGDSMRKLIAICMFAVFALPLAAQTPPPALKLPRVSQHEVLTQTVGLTDI